MDEHILLCSLLTLERCKNYCNHIHAVLYMCADDADAIDHVGSAHIRRLVSLLNMELQGSYDMMAADGDSAV